MPDPVTARAFHHADGLSDWRVCDGGASAWFATRNLTTGNGLSSSSGGEATTIGR